MRTWGWWVARRGEEGSSVSLSVVLELSRRSFALEAKFSGVGGGDRSQNSCDVAKPLGP